MTSPAPQPLAQPDPDVPADLLPAEPVPCAPGPLSAACAAGTVRLYRVRATGTTRAVPYLAEDNLQREVAEWLATAIEEGQSLRAVATDTGLSLPTARRLVTALAITEEIEAGDWDDHYAPDVTALYFGYVDALPDDTASAEETATTEEAAA